jgi:hypothetical protein
VPFISKAVVFDLKPFAEILILFHWDHGRGIEVIQAGEAMSNYSGSVFYLQMES